MADLVLGDGYPFPYPEGLSEDEHEAIVGASPVEGLRLRGVRSFEWRFTVTVRFMDRDAYEAAKAATGWAEWDRELTLEAPTSGPDGREFPAIIVGDTAYCRLFIDG